MLHSKTATIIGFLCFLFCLIGGQKASAQYTYAFVPKAGEYTKEGNGTTPKWCNVNGVLLKYENRRIVITVSDERSTYIEIKWKTVGSPTNLGDEFVASSLRPADEICYNPAENFDEEQSNVPISQGTLRIQKSDLPEGITPVRVMIQAIFQRQLIQYYSEPINIIKAKSNDFYISNESLTKTTVKPGDGIFASCRQYYSGSSTNTFSPKVGIYFSSDDKRDDSDTFLAEQTSEISANDTYDAEIAAITIPTNLSSGIYYILFVADHDGRYIEGNEKNNVESVKITVQGVPPIPANVNATDGECAKVSITWDASTGANSYKVYRGNVYLGITTNTFYEDHNGPNSPVTYKVEAINNVGISDFGIDTGYEGSRADPPGNVSASDGTYTDKVRITWQHSPNANGYEIYIGPNLIGTTTKNYFDDFNASTNVTTYKVYAVNNCFNSLKTEDTGFRRPAYNLVVTSFKTGSPLIKGHQKHIYAIIENKGTNWYRGWVYLSWHSYAGANLTDLDKKQVEIAPGKTVRLESDRDPVSSPIGDYTAVVKYSVNGNEPFQTIDVRQVKVRGVEYLQTYPTVTDGDPVNMLTGENVWGHNDFLMNTMEGVMAFQRTYRSRANYSRAFGQNWRHNFDIYLEITSELWTLHQADGNQVYYVPDGSGGSEARPLFNTDTLYYENSLYTLIKKNGVKYRFDRSGLLINIIFSSGNTIYLNYRRESSGKINLISIFFPRYRSLYFTYDHLDRITKIADNAGRETSYIYNSSGQLIEATNVRGDKVTYTYDANGYMTSIKDARQNIIVENTYDHLGRVIAQKDALGNPSFIAYDTPTTNATTFTNVLGHSTVYNHDAFHRLVEVKNPLGHSRKLGYDGFSYRMSQVTNEKNISTHFSYDSNYNLVKVKDATEAISEIKYNEFNDPVLMTNALGNSTAINYNQKRNPTLIAYPDSSKIQISYFSNGLVAYLIDRRSDRYDFGYSRNGDLITIGTSTGEYKITRDLSGKPIAITDRNGKTDSITTDSYGNITHWKDKMGYTQEWQYNPNGYPVSYKDKNGATTYYHYDPRDLLISIINAKNDTTIFEYDDLGRRTKIQKPEGNQVEFKYNSLSQLIEYKNSLGKTQFLYDSTGNRTHIITPSKDTSRVVYDVLNRPVLAINALGDTTQKVIYDELGRLVTVFDGNNNHKIFEYDVMNQLVSTTDALGGILKYIRGKSGLINQMIDADSNIITYTRNDQGLVTNVKYGETQLGTATYDNEGYLITSTYNNITATITRNENYFPIKIDYSNGKSYELNRDKNGWVSELSNDHWTSKISLLRDQLGNVIQSTDVDGNVIKYEYNKNQNRKSVTYGKNKQVFTEYNGVDLPQKTSDWLGNYQRWVYNTNGGIDSVINSNNTCTTIQWDRLQRMKSYVNLNKKNEVINAYEFSYDKNYQIIDTKAQEPLQPNLETRLDVFTFSEGGRFKTMNGIPVISQASGEITEIGDFKNAQWLEGDLLSGYQYGNDTIRNFYNPLGQRTRRLKNSEEIRYVLDHSTGLSHVLQEKDRDGNTLNQYVQTPFGLGWYVDADNQERFYHFSYSGNTIGLTNREGILTDKYAYTLFGDYPTHQGSSKQPYQFGGQYGIQRDVGSIYHVRARTLNGHTGSFLSQDAYPISLTNGQSFNRYHYGYNDPVSYVDFDGYQASAQDIIPLFKKDSYDDNNYWISDALTFGYNVGVSVVNESISSINDGVALVQEVRKNGLINTANRVYQDGVAVVNGVYYLAQNTSFEDVKNYISSSVNDIETYESLVANLIPSPGKLSKLSKIDDIPILPPKNLVIKDDRLDHIKSDHWPGAKTPYPKGQFSSDITEEYLKTMLGLTIQFGTTDPNNDGREGFIKILTFSNPIGITHKGTPTNTLKVVIKLNGEVYTAYPYKNPD